MTQTQVTSPLNAGFPGGTGSTLLMDGEFFFDLDSFQQCASELELDSMRLPSASTAGDFGYASSGADGGMEMFEALSANPATNLNQQRESAMHYQSDISHHQAVTPQSLNQQSGYCSATEPSNRPMTGEANGQELTVSAPKVPKKRNQNRSRKRQREELEQLRTSVQELQIQLDTLLSGDATADAGDQLCASNHREDLQLFVRQALVWKRAASIEKQQREYAAVENMKLRALIEESALVCKTFGEVCSKSYIPIMPQVDSSFTHVNLTRVPTCRARSDTARFDALHQSLYAQYERLSTVWDECNFTSSTAETKQLNQLRRDSDQFYFEHSKSHIYPFSPDAVSRTVWKIMKAGLLTPNNGEVKICRVVDNTLFATLVDRIPLIGTQDEEATVRVWVTLKRFIEDHQIAVAWQAEVEIEHIHSHVRLSESGWNVMRSLDQVHGGNTHGLTTKAPCISQICIRATPDTHCAIREDELAIGSVTASVLAQYYQSMSMLNQTIENLLLDESLATVVQ